MGGGKESSFGAWAGLAPTPVGTWASLLNSLSFGFLICKLEIMGAAASLRLKKMK